MNDIEQTILREIASLPEARLADVLAFVRYLKISLRDEKRIKKDFKEALKQARETAEKYNISQQDIDSEIRSVREVK